MNLSGKMIHEAFVSTLPTEAKKEWHQISVIARLSYIKTAQILDVKTGQANAKDIEYLFIASDQVTEASDIEGLATVVHIQADEEFKILLIVNGQETGYGWYDVCGDLNEGGEIGLAKCGGEDEEYGSAVGLFQQLEKHLKALQTKQVA